MDSARLALVAIIAGASVAGSPGRGRPPDAAARGPLLAAPYRAPFTPSKDEERLQEVPSAGDPKVVQMRTLRRELDAAPQDLQNALRLADSYIDYGRQIGDAHYVGYAEAVIAPWTGLAAPPASALLTQATILQYRHQFADSLTLLQATLRLEPRNPRGWLTLATLDMVQGRYEAARRDCAQVMNSAGLEPGGACLGSVLSYIGHARQSLVLLHQSDVSAAGSPVPYRAWVQSLIAEAAERLGDWPLAEMHYRAALELSPHDNFLLVAYADFLLDRGRPREVLALLADHSQSDTAFLRLALAEDAMQSPEATRYKWIMAARFEALAQRGSEYFGREEARAALRLQHDPQTALAMATRNWEVQRAPWDARVLLEAAIAARQPRAATAVLAFLEETKLEDPIVLSLARQVRAQSAVEQ